MFSFTYKGIDFSHKLDYASSPKDEYSKHMHRFDEIVFFVNGDVSYTVESKTRRLKRGDIIFIKAGEYHFATVNNNDVYERYVLKLSENTINEHLREKLSKLSPFFINSNKEKEIVTSFDYYFGIYDKEDLYLMYICKTIELLILLANRNNKKSAEISDNILAKTINYIEENIMNQLSLETVSKTLNYSKSHLSSIFKSEMKCSIMKYIKAKKIFKAYRLISEGKMPHEVAETLGFKDYSTFYRSFVKIVGYSPAKVNCS